MPLNKENKPNLSFWLCLLKWLLNPALVLQTFKYKGQKWLSDGSRWYLIRHSEIAFVNTLRFFKVDKDLQILNFMT